MERLSPAGVHRRGRCCPLLAAGHLMSTAVPLLATAVVAGHLMLSLMPPLCR